MAMPSNQISYGLNECIDSAPPITALERQWAANEKARVLAARVGQLADRIVGSAPTSGCSAKSPELHGGLMDRIEIDAMRMGEEIEAALSALMRIERALPQT